MMLSVILQYMLMIQNDIQRFEFTGGVRTKILFTHSSLEILNKFQKKSGRGRGFTFHFVEIFYFVEILSISELNFSVLRAIEI